MKKGNFARRVVDIMDAEQDLLCAYERAIDACAEGSPQRRELETLFHVALDASMHTQQTIFSAVASRASPEDFVQALTDGRELKDLLADDDGGGDSRPA